MRQIVPNPYLMKKLAPPCHSTHISNEYFLEIKLEYSGFCCPNSQSLQIPLSIIPMNDIIGFAEPAGSHFIELGQFKFQLVIEKPQSAF